MIDNDSYRDASSALLARIIQTLWTVGWGDASNSQTIGSHNSRLRHCHFGIGLHHEPKRLDANGFGRVYRSER
ncbi:hypothetical protein CUJ84_Chr003259 [Rhizobium leguminosarum]|uniref:Uncharacterized protein n=1 Tax=Rhizobium leguminosarum TaxID=384 RepID=A0A2K9Z5T3_RHILE|nr:hypothetical protein CUJ84_Chr003259 [Rhizobium leguminosarum]